jgi:PleD family two-component response regulator
MPGIEGFELCSKIHETVLNRKTPVVFVTHHNDFQARSKSALTGAQDLIAKPFLTFEITVKALTLVLRERLSKDRRPACEPRGVGTIATSAQGLGPAQSTGLPSPVATA